MKTVRKILKYFLGVMSGLYIISIIMAFCYSWNAGLIFVLSELLLIALFITFTEGFQIKQQNKKFKNPARILLFVLFMISANWGSSVLNNDLDYIKYKSESENKSIENTSESANEIDEVKPETLPAIDTSKLIEFQKTWSDSIVKSNNGSYILSSKLSTRYNLFRVKQRCYKIH